MATSAPVMEPSKAEPIVTPNSNQQAGSISLAEYFIHRLKEVGNRVVFALSGDYLSPFTDALEQDAEMQMVNVSSEQEGGYAAAGYAMAQDGVPGVIAVTYGVGSFNVLNALTAAWTEQLPVILVNGSPSNAQLQTYQIQDVLNHHMIDLGVRTQLEIFAKVTTSAFIVDHPGLARLQIDEAISRCVNLKLPVYLEVFQDVWKARVPFETSPRPLETKLAPIASASLNSAITTVFNACQSSKRPLIWAGIEITRQNATKALEELLNAWSKVNPNVRIATNLFSKTQVGIDENDPRFIGVLDGALATAEAKQALNESDLLLQLGTVLTDLEVAGMTLEEFTKKNYFVASKQTVAGANRFLATGVPLHPLLTGLAKSFASLPATSETALAPNEVWALPGAFHYLQEIGLKDESTPLSYDVFAVELEKLFKDSFGNQEFRLIVDSTLALFPAAHLKLKPQQFHCETVWGSIGFSAGACIGIKLACPNDRMLVVIGDGGLQNNPGSLSTIAYNKQNTIVFVIQNELYAIDQWIIGKDVFSDPQKPLPKINVLPRWNFALLSEAVGGRGWNVTSVQEFRAAVKEAIGNPTLSVISMKVDQRDCPSFMKLK